MIVKNEAAVILRCLDSVRPIIDYWVIVDTGSTDGTQDIIRNALQNVQGELHERPWVDFAHNRTEALDLARTHGDFSLVIDADDVLEFAPGFKLPFLNADTYAIEIRNKDRRYWRPQLTRNAIPWRYEGVLHEFLSCVDNTGQRVLAENRSQKRLAGTVIRMSEDGARRQSSAAERFHSDAAILKTALAIETDSFLVSRYTFYLAQSYLDAGDKQKALQTYEDRSRLGGWDQEIFISLYRAANLKAELGSNDPDDIIETYLRAHTVCKSRAEALHGAARYCCIKERFQQGYDLAKRALTLKVPGDGLFLESWIYDYGILDEYAVNTYWIGAYDECLKACRKILSLQNIPDELRNRVQANANFASRKLREVPGA